MATKKLTIKDLEKENNELKHLVLFLISELMDKSFERIDTLLDFMDRPQVLAGHFFGGSKSRL